MTRPLCRQQEHHRRGLVVIEPPSSAAFKLDHAETFPEPDALAARRRLDGEQAFD